MSFIVLNHDKGYRHASMVRGPLYVGAHTAPGEAWLNFTVWKRSAFIGLRYGHDGAALRIGNGGRPYLGIEIGRNW